MAFNPVVIVNVIRKVVSDFTPAVLPIIKANEKAALGSTKIDTINFQNGHIEELLQTLYQDDKSPEMKTLKYPLVYLAQDFKERRGRKAGFYANTDLSIAIAHQTVDTYKSMDRYKNVIIPVLYPIYAALMNGLAASSMINESSEDLIQHDKIDRLFWGTSAIGMVPNTANKLNDYVDAIEISGLNVTILYNNC